MKGPFPPKPVVGEKMELLKTVVLVSLVEMSREQSRYLGS
jgi:hypothetical protein